MSTWVHKLTTSHRYRPLVVIRRSKLGICGTELPPVQQWRCGHYTKASLCRSLGVFNYKAVLICSSAPPPPPCHYHQHKTQDNKHTEENKRSHWVFCGVKVHGVVSSVLSCADFHLHHRFLVDGFAEEVYGRHLLVRRCLRWHRNPQSNSLVSRLPGFEEMQMVAHRNLANTKPAKTI